MTCGNRVRYMKKKTFFFAMHKVWVNVNSQKYFN